MRTINRNILVAVIIVLPYFLKAQNLREQLQQCPVIIENGKINYYMPQQNGTFFQLPPARKPQYVNILTVPWVQALTKSVQQTQTETLASLLEFTTQNNPKKDDKELFLRKLAWCIMLQTSKAKEIDIEIINYVRSMEAHTDETLVMKAKLVESLVEDYRNFSSQRP